MRFSPIAALAMIVAGVAANSPLRDINAIKRRSPGHNVARGIVDLYGRPVQEATLRSARLRHARRALLQRLRRGSYASVRVRADAHRVSSGRILVTDFNDPSKSYGYVSTNLDVYGLFTVLGTLGEPLNVSFTAPTSAYSEVRLSAPISGFDYFGIANGVNSPSTDWSATDGTTSYGFAVACASSGQAPSTDAQNSSSDPAYESPNFTLHADGSITASWFREDGTAVPVIIFYDTQEDYLGYTPNFDNFQTTYGFETPVQVALTLVPA